MTVYEKNKEALEEKFPGWLDEVENFCYKQEEKKSCEQGKSEEDNIEKSLLIKEKMAYDGSPVLYRTRWKRTIFKWKI